MSLRTFLCPVHKDHGGGGDVDRLLTLREANPLHSHSPLPRQAP